MINVLWAPFSSLSRNSLVLVTTLVATAFLFLTLPRRPPVNHEVKQASESKSCMEPKWVLSHAKQTEDFTHMTDFYKLTAKVRYLANNPQKEKDGVVRTPKSLHALMQSILPQIACETKVRVGNTGDGGKWVCNPWRLPEDCIIYSLGIGRELSFEAQLQALTEDRCKIYGIDPGANDYYAKIVPRSMYIPLKIGPKTDLESKVSTISDIMGDLGHKRADILKMDIEFAEFEVLPLLFENTTPSSQPIACHLLVEVHEQSFLKWSRLMRMLEKAGFWLYSKEPNTFCTAQESKTLCCEYSFIHESCREDYNLPKSSFLLNFGET